MTSTEKELIEQVKVAEIQLEVKKTQLEKFRKNDFARKDLVKCLRTLADALEEGAVIRDTELDFFKLGNTHRKFTMAHTRGTDVTVNIVGNVL